jgi:hypothetical protein
MSIQLKHADVWRTIVQPWIKVNDTHTRATKVFTKVAGVWREAWPLKPGPPGAPITTTVYRNDRIEIDSTWTAPSTGEPTVKYIVSVKIGTAAGGPFSWTTTVVVNAPTTAMTLTDDPRSGFHTLAGQQVYVSVIAQSAAGRNSDEVSGLPVTMSQLPAPPQPTSYSVSINQCYVHHTWSHSGGRRIDGVELHVSHNGTGSSWTYYPWVTEADFQSWNPATIGGGWVICYCRTYGPGGVSPWVTVSGNLPNAISTWGYRWGDGYLRVNTSGVFPAVQVHAQTYGFGWGYYGDFQANAGEVYVPDSVNWPRNNQYVAMLLRPINNANGWVGRDQWLGWAVKLSWPYFVGPVDSQTWRGGGWRSEQHQDWQGATQQGENAAFFFYGNQFYDLLSAAAIGYDVGINSAYIALHRENAGGLGQAISPQLIVHRAGWIGEDTNWGGNFHTWGLVRGQLAWVPVPGDWIWYLKERWDGWKGLGLYAPSTGLISSAGYVSAEYMILKAWNYGTIENGTLWLDTVAIYHNG